MRLKATALMVLVAILGTIVLLVPATLAGSQKADNPTAQSTAHSEKRLAEYQARLLAEKVAAEKARKAAELRAARDAERKALEKKKAAEKRTAPPKVKSIAPNTGANRALGKRMAAEKGWTGVQWTCLNNLWTRESGWKHTVYNYSGSGAYGIPQALPGSKMANAGSDWRTNPATQIRWGLKYIQSRYKTPCGAWSAFQSKGWY